MLALVGPTGTQAAPFTAPYVFAGSSVGSAGWSSADVPSPSSWYSTSLGAGGITVSPTGNGGQIYDNDLRGGTQFTAPAGTTVLSAALSGVDGRGADGQRARVNLVPQPYFELLGGESWGKATTVDGTSLPTAFTLTPPVGQTASALQVRLYPIACGNPGLGQPNCQNAPANSQARMNVGQVTVTLDDPTPPAVALGGVAGGWTNASSVTATVTGADTESGTSRVALDVKAGSSTKRLTLGTWAQDTSGNALPGWPQSQAGSGTVQLPRTGAVTLTGRAANGANTESASGPVTIRIDRVVPKVTWPKKLQGGQSVTVRDGESGLAAATVTLDGQPVTSSCPAAAKQCKLRIPTKARGSLRIAATDIAGNPTTQSRQVVPAPRKGGAGSNGGGSRHPDKGGGTKKPSASYCRKHPSARACSSPSSSYCRAHPKARSCARNSSSSLFKGTPRPISRTFRLKAANKVGGRAPTAIYGSSRFTNFCRPKWRKGEWSSADADTGRQTKTFAIPGKGYRTGMAQMTASSMTCRNGATAVLPTFHWNASGFAPSGDAKTTLIVASRADRRDHASVNFLDPLGSEFNQDDVDPQFVDQARAVFFVLAAPADYRPRKMGTLYMSMRTKPLAMNVGRKTERDFREYPASGRRSARARSTKAGR